MGLFRKNPKRMESALRVTTDDDDWEQHLKPLRFGQRTYDWCCWRTVIQDYTPSPALRSGQLEVHGTGDDEGRRFVFSHACFFGSTASSEQQRKESQFWAVGNRCAVVGLGDTSRSPVLYYPVLVWDLEAGGCLAVDDWLNHIMSESGASQPHANMADFLRRYFGGIRKEELRRCFLRYWCATSEIYWRSVKTGNDLVKTATKEGNARMHDFWD